MRASPRVSSIEEQHKKQLVADLNTSRGELSRHLAEQEVLRQKIDELHSQIASVRDALLGGHRQYESNITQMNRHWVAAKHYSSLTGGMATLVVAGLSATVENSREDNLGRKLAGILAGVSGFACAMFTLVFWFHYKKSQTVREELSKTNPTLVRSTFSGSTYYPLAQTHKSALGQPLLGENHTASTVIRLRSDDGVFVTEDNKAWIEARTAQNQGVTAVLMGLVGVAIGTGACLAFSGACSIQTSGGDQSMVFILGLSIAAIGAIAHCAAVDRWQRLPDQLGGEPSDQLLQLH